MRAYSRKLTEHQIWDVVNYLRSIGPKKAGKSDLPNLLDPAGPMKIVVADDLPASALDLLRAEAGWIVDARSGRAPAALAADLPAADALLVRSATKVTAQRLDAAPTLRFGSRAATG